MSAPIRDWFVDGEGIDRGVITAHIQLYLGNEVTVRPGTSEGKAGYWIKSYRNLTKAQTDDLKHKSHKYRQEQQKLGPRDYTKSQTFQQTKTPSRDDADPYSAGPSSTRGPPPGRPPPERMPLGRTGNDGMIATAPVRQDSFYPPSGPRGYVQEERPYLPSGPGRPMYEDDHVMSEDPYRRPSPRPRPDQRYRSNHPPLPANLVAGSRGQGVDYAPVTLDRDRSAAPGRLHEPAFAPPTYQGSSMDRDDRDYSWDPMDLGDPLNAGDPRHSSRMLPPIGDPRDLPRPIRAQRDPRDNPQSRDSRNQGEPRYVRDPRDQQPRNLSYQGDPRYIRDQRDPQPRDLRDQGDSRYIRDLRDEREGREPRESRNNRYGAAGFAEPRFPVYPNLDSTQGELVRETMVMSPPHNPGGAPPPSRFDRYGRPIQSEYPPPGPPRDLGYPPGPSDGREHRRRRMD